MPVPCRRIIYKWGTRSPFPVPIFDADADMKKLSWEDIENIADELSKKILASGFMPDYIIGITTGGLIPLYFMSKKLNVSRILVVSASSYEKEQQKALEISYLPEVDLFRQESVACG